ncbi:phage protein NinX family protein [Morganella morganii]|uniref:phage protein NinX family protein n=1 Tax=Morganella morganii TaxID=582 RepID=UPI001BDB9522|nr:phage protein NinX family protein [Morganella morganii]MBT0442259.1 DUF2591 family protein [Morganella morganii subsp. morganii]
MNKYRDKSDFEINKAVADFYLMREHRFNSADKIVELMDIDLSCEFGGEINLKDKYVTGTFDPCNNPADAMPIVIENGISLISDWNEIGVWGATYQPWYTSENKNPLRAAMEVFLMMKDAENEK